MNLLQCLKCFHLRETSEQFQVEMESISEELNEIRISKENLVIEDNGVEEENKQLWVVANKLQEEKDNVKSF